MTHTSKLLLCVAALAGSALAVPARAAETPDGAKVYKDKCAFCHGKQGTPMPALAKQGVRNFNDPTWVKSTSLEKIRQTIETGVKGTLMRSFKKELSPEEMDAVAKFVHDLHKPKE